MKVRDVRDDDAEAIATIYGHHVLHGTASYDLEPPPAEFHRDKIRRIAAAGWPFIVAEVDGRLAGYAYVTQFRDRAAYRYTAEDSVYVDPQMAGRGIGKMLLQALLARSAAYGFSTIIAVIGGAEPVPDRAPLGLPGFHEAGSHALHAAGGSTSAGSPASTCKGPSPDRKAASSGQRGEAVTANDPAGRGLNTSLAGTAAASSQALHCSAGSTAICRL